MVAEMAMVMAMAIIGYRRGWRFQDGVRVGVFGTRSPVLGDDGFAASDCLDLRALYCNPNASFEICIDNGSSSPLVLLLIFVTNGSASKGKRR